MENLTTQLQRRKCPERGSDYEGSPETEEYRRPGSESALISMNMAVARTTKRNGRVLIDIADRKSWLLSSESDDLVIFKITRYSRGQGDWIDIILQKQYKTSFAATEHVSSATCQFLESWGVIWWIRTLILISLHISPCLVSG